MRDDINKEMNDLRGFITEYSSKVELKKAEDAEKKNGSGFAKWTRSKEEKDEMSAFLSTTTSWKT